MRGSLHVGVLVRFSVCADEKGEKEITPKVNGLLSLLTERQYQWVLLDEDDQGEGLVVLAPSEAGFSPEAAVSALPKKKDQVTDPDGTAAGELLLREYADGTAVILDLRDGGEERELLFRGERVLLSPRGHILFPSKQERYAFFGIAAIRLDCFGQYARFFVDGEDLGGRYAGYVWEIPEKYFGKTVRLTVLQYTSLGPVFGRTKDVVTDGDGEWWAPLAKWFPGRYEALGLGKAEFVKKV